MLEVQYFVTTACAVLGAIVYQWLYHLYFLTFAKNYEFSICKIANYQKNERKSIIGVGFKIIVFGGSDFVIKISENDNNFFIFQ